MRIFRKTIPSAIIDKSVELVKDYARDIKKRAFIFCESKATLSFERALCEKYGGTFSVSVTSFSRYAATHKKTVRYLDKSSATLIVANVIAENRDKILRLKKHSFKTALAVFELISQLKSAKITPNDLSIMINAETSALTHKLRDVALVYSGYENYIKEHGFSDDCDILKTLPELFAKDDDLRGAKVVVAGINNFTAQTIDAVIALKTFADLDCVVLSYDGDSALNESFNKLLSLFSDKEIVEDDRDYIPEVIAIKDRLLCEERASDKGSFSDRIVIAEATDPFEEARFVAREIKRQIVFCGKRFKDFAVACPAVSEYEDAFLSAFSDNGLTLYADIGRKLSAHPMVAVFSAAAELKKRLLRLDEAYSLVCLPAAFDRAEADLFRNYVSKNAVKRYGLKKHANDPAFESLREKLLLCVDKLSDNATIARHIANIREVFDILGTYGKLENAESALLDAGEGASASFLSQGVRAFDLLLDKTGDLLGGKIVDLSDFTDLILSSTAAKEIYVLPQYSDGVFLGDFKSVRNLQSKVLFCVGMTADTPLVKADDALLNDKELNKMKSFSLVVEPMISIVNRRESENVATTLMSFSEKLFVTYPIVDAGGGKKEKSRFIEYLVNAFSDNGRSPLVRANDDHYRQTDPLSRYGATGAGVKSAIEDAQDFSAGKTVDLSAASAFLDILREKDERLFDTVTQGYFEGDISGDGDISYRGAIYPTFIENYHACPYSAFLKNVLRLKDSPTAEMKNYEVGSALHKAMEVFCGFTDVTEDNLDFCAEKAANEALSAPDLSKYSDDGENSFFLGILKNEAVKYCKSLFEERKKTEFKVFGNELCIGELDGRQDFKPVEIETEFGKIVLKGKIDRLDVCDCGNKTLAHVIDYKTGSDVEGKISPQKLYYGENVQIYLYMGAIADAGFTPVAVHYCALSDEYKKPYEKNKIYFGYLLNDGDYLKKLDVDFDKSGKSDLYGVNVKYAKRTQAFVTKERMEDLIDYARKISANCAEGAARGEFFASPTGSGCKYCNFKGSCRFDGDNAFLRRDTLSVNGDAVSQAVRGAEDEN